MYKHCHLLIFSESPTAQDVAGRRVWSDEQMIEMVTKILQGFTYRDITDGTLVPMSTLWTRLYIILLSLDVYFVDLI